MTVFLAVTIDIDVKVIKDSFKITVNVAVAKNKKQQKIMPKQAKPPLNDTVRHAK
tara:strand:+ start:1544 stop:1708 length:165 start_codon:yes stop_codon:yes gene_type:complete